LRKKKGVNQSATYVSQQVLLKVWNMSCFSPSPSTCPPYSDNHCTRWQAKESSTLKPQQQEIPCQETYQQCQMRRDKSEPSSSQRNGEAENAMQQQRGGIGRNTLADGGKKQKPWRAFPTLHLWQQFQGPREALAEMNISSASPAASALA
jgi:hypothetical protein